MPAKKSTKTKKKMPKKASAKKVSTKKVSTKKVSIKNQQKHQNLLQRKKYRLKLKLHWQIISLKLHLTSLEKMKNI